MGQTTPHTALNSPNLPVDALIAEIARRQHGASPASSSGRSDAPQPRIAAGRLHAIHRGAYAIGHPRLSDKATC